MDKAQAKVRFTPGGSQDNQGVTANLSGAVVAVQGYGGWTTVDRPRRTAQTVWQGFTPLQLAIPIYFLDTGGLATGIENLISKLSVLAGRGKVFPTASVNSAGHVRFYKWKKGDTIQKVARHLDVDPGDLLNLNGVTDPRHIPVNTSLKIPKPNTQAPFGEPPAIFLQADAKLIPYNDISYDDDDNEFRYPQWVIDNIEWATDVPDVILNHFGYRVRQAATVTVTQYVPARNLVSSATDWRRKKAKKT